MSNHFSRSFGWLVVPFAALLCTGPALAQPEGQYEAVLHGVKYYGDPSETPPECCIGCSDLPAAMDAVKEMRDGFKKIGYAQVAYWFNSSVNGVDFYDSNLFPFGLDNWDDTGTDFADVIFFTGHGTSFYHTDCHSEIQMGAYDGRWSNGLCTVRTDDHIRFGSPNGDADVAIFNACQSLQRETTHCNGYSPMFQGAFSTYLGFHGNTTSELILERGYDYVVDAKWNGIGELWVDYATDLNGNGSHDICGTALLYGKDRATIDNQYQNGGFRDLKDIRPRNTGRYYFWCGCDSQDAQPLPDC